MAYNDDPNPQRLEQLKQQVHGRVMRWKTKHGADFALTLSPMLVAPMARVDVIAERVSDRIFRGDRETFLAAVPEEQDRTVRRIADTLKDDAKLARIAGVSERAVVLGVSALEDTTAGLATAGKGLRGVPAIAAIARTSKSGARCDADLRARAARAVLEDPHGMSVSVEAAEATGSWTGELGNKLSFSVRRAALSALAEAMRREKRRGELVAQAIDDLTITWMSVESPNHATASDEAWAAWAEEVEALPAEEVASWERLAHRTRTTEQLLLVLEVSRMSRLVGGEAIAQFARLDSGEAFPNVASTRRGALILEGRKSLPIVDRLCEEGLMNVDPADPKDRDRKANNVDKWWKDQLAKVVPELADLLNRNGAHFAEKVALLRGLVRGLDS